MMRKPFEILMGKREAMREIERYEETFGLLYILEDEN
jgi:hypothetical protein